MAQRNDRAQPGPRAHPPRPLGGLTTVEIARAFLVPEVEVRPIVEW
jgi:hypothetical protein